MTRKLFSLAGVLIAVFSFTVGSTDAEARHCGRQRGRCCQQTACQSTGNFGCGQRVNCGSGCGQVRSIGCQQMSHQGCQQQSRCCTATTACCTPQSAGYQSGGYIVQPTDGTGAPNGPPAPPVEPAIAPAPAPRV